MDSITDLDRKSYKTSLGLSDTEMAKLSTADLKKLHLEALGIAEPSSNTTPLDPIPSFDKIKPKK